MTTWNPKHAQEAPCKRCGHPYHRHFDSYEGNAPVGCKYCRCATFIEADGSYIVESPLQEALRNALSDALSWGGEGDSDLVVLLRELQERREAASRAAAPESCAHHGHEPSTGCTCPVDCYCVTRTCRDRTLFVRHRWEPGTGSGDE